MQPLNPKFLKLIARKYDLTDEQQEVFVSLFSTSKTPQDIADGLHISSNALRNRMTGAYNKFSFTDKKPNKARRLHDWLLKQEQEYISESERQKTIDNADIEQLVVKVRQAIEADVKERCGKMQVLDMTQAIGLDDIYTDVNILEKPNALRRFSLEQLQKTHNFNLEQLKRIGLGSIKEERVAGINAVEKHANMVIWGKPGAGKTTFLKYLAIKCISGQFKSNHIPIFITLKDFAENKYKYGLGMYIAKYIAKFYIPEHLTDKLLRSGKFLIFLDGLDEVKHDDTRRVIKQIHNTAVIYYQNQYVITCRIAAKEYTFQNFTEVEIADFDLEQIKAFVNNWFRLKDPVKAEKFLAKFEHKKSIQELATNPLLLTLLCLVFEEKLDFTANRAELYEEGIDIMLRKWDAERNIERDEVYRRLTLKRKKDLLSKIAFTSFENSTYFFKQKTLEEYVASYIQNLPDAHTDDAVLLFDSQKIIKSIVAQHGLLVPRAKNIYSFSHLTFHEYFTARQIIEVDKSTKLVIKNFVKHLWQKSWREVFLLAIEMSSKADVLVLLMKREIDSLLAHENLIQELLIWSNRTALHTYQTRIPANIKKTRRMFGLIVNNNYPLIRNLCLYIYLNFDRRLEAKLLNYNEIKYFEWEQGNSYECFEELKNELKNTMIECSNISHDCQLNTKQRELLIQYCKANQFLTQCMAQECYVSRHVRQYIEETLLLPISEIEKCPDPLAN